MFEIGYPGGLTLFIIAKWLYLRQMLYVRDLNIIYYDLAGPFGWFID